MGDDEDAREAALLARVGEGDRGAPLVELYRAYAGPVLGLGLRTFGDHHQAEELVQETFVRLWRSAGSFDARRGTARAFTFTIAHRTAVDLLRRAGARPRLAATGGGDVRAVAGGRDAGQDEAERMADSLLVREAVATLSPKHREVIALTFDDDLADGEIAERLGVPVGTVRSRTYYALRALRVELEERGLLG